MYVWNTKTSIFCVLYPLHYIVTFGNNTNVVKVVMVKVVMVKVVMVKVVMVKVVMVKVVMVKVVMVKVVKLDF